MGSAGDARDAAPSLPLRVVVMLPCPKDAPPFDAESSWRDLSVALRPLEAQNLVAVDRVTPATEQALRQRLAGGPCDVLHIVGHASWRAAVRYGTLTFENTGGMSRSVTTPFLGKLLAGYPRLRLAVLQPCGPLSAFDSASYTVWEQGPAVLLSERTWSGRPQAVFAARLYASLATGSTITEAAAHAHGGLAGIAPDATMMLIGSGRNASLLQAQPAGAGTMAGSGADARTHEMAAPAKAVPDEAALHREAVRAEARRELTRKRACAEFDVFLCHNGADKPAVRAIAARLEESGILPWLDERELPPGQPWQPLLEKQIGHISAAAVFVGAAGVGPWQEQELYGFLREFVSRRSPVIPVLLADAPDAPELPIFLKAMTWVDFRVRDPDPLARLIWGITGRRPEGG